MEHINAGTQVNFSLARGFGSFAFSALALGLGYLINRYGSEIIMPLTLVFSLIGAALVSTFSKVIDTAAHSIQIVRHVGGNMAEMGIAGAIGSFIELPAMALFPLLMGRVKQIGTLLKWSGVFFVLKALLTLLAPTLAGFM